MSTESSNSSLPMIIGLLALAAAVGYLAINCETEVDTSPRNSMPDKLYINDLGSETVTRCSKSAFSSATHIAQAVDEKGNTQQYFCQ